jgi:hypothetical protein
MADDDRNDAKSEDTATQAGEAPETELERARKLILERRNRFMAAALAGIGMASGSACMRASVCLSLIPASGGGAGEIGGGSGGAGAAGGGSGGTGPNGPCPGQPWRSQPPCVCLTAPLAGSAGPFAGTIAPPAGGTIATPTAGRSGTGGTGGRGGTAGTRPNVCLSPPIDQDAGTESEP